MDGVLLGTPARPMEEQGWSFLEGLTSSLKVGQDGALMVHTASLRTMLRALPCWPDLILVLGL